MAQTFDCTANNYAGIILVIIDIKAVNGMQIVPETILGISIAIFGSVPVAGISQAPSLGLTISIQGTGSSLMKNNWVAWSKIGQISFANDLTGDSGKIMMPWQGQIYQIKQLEKNAVVYGSGGITMLMPVTKPLPTYGSQDMPFKGIFNSTAVCGNSKKHFFVDTQCKLWQLSEVQPLHIQHFGGPKLLDYSEYIKQLASNFTMHYDQVNDRCYLSDSTQGLAYIKNQGLGGGYGNMTGFEWNGSNTFVTAPSQNGFEPFGTPPSQNGLVLPTQELCTDIFDLMTRDLKLISTIEVGCDATNALYVAVDYRYDKSQPFQTTGWYLLNSNGWANPVIAGIEFRLRVKNTTYEYIQFSYINVHYKFIDKRATRSQRMIKRATKTSA
jgi:hypothetical protein